MILDPVIISEILIDGPAAQLAADTIRSISSSGKRVATTFVGAGEITRYVLFLGKLRPYLFRNQGVKGEVEGAIDNVFSTSMFSSDRDLQPSVMMIAYRLSFSSGLNFSVSHLASSAAASGESILCARGTVALLASVQGLSVEIVREFGKGEIAEISVQITKSSILKGPD
jgi:hypothetical protein